MAGLPLYGQSFTLADPAHSGLGAAVLGRGEAGEFTRAGGFLAYYEICQKLRAGWREVQVPGELSILSRAANNPSVLTMMTEKAPTSAFIFMTLHMLDMELGHQLKGHRLFGKNG